MSRTICAWAGMQRGHQYVHMCSSERIDCTKHLKRTLIALVLNDLIITFLTRRSSRSTTYWLLKLFRFPFRVHLNLQPCTYASLLFSNHLHFTDALVTENPLLIQEPQPMIQVSSLEIFDKQVSQFEGQWPAASAGRTEQISCINSTRTHMWCLHLQQHCSTLLLSSSAHFLLNTIHSHNNSSK